MKKKKIDKKTINSWALRLILLSLLVATILSVINDNVSNFNFDIIDNEYIDTPKTYLSYEENRTYVDFDGVDIDGTTFMVNLCAPID